MSVKVVSDVADDRLQYVVSPAVVIPGRWLSVSFFRRGGRCIRFASVNELRGRWETLRFCRDGRLRNV